MARKPTVFGLTAFMLPREWLDALDAPRHRQQADVLVVAQLKADAAAALMQRGAHVYPSEPPRVALPWQTTQRLLDSGLLRLSSLGQTLCYARAVGGSLIVEVAEYGAPVVVGHWSYDRATHSLTVREGRPA